MLMFGGYSTQIGTGSTAATAGWQHNSLHWLDLSAMSFTEIKQTQFYPEPRKYHSAVMVGTTIPSDLGFPSPDAWAAQANAPLPILLRRDG